MTDVLRLLRPWLLRWVTFATIVLDPLALILFLATVALMVFGAGQAEKTDKTVSTAAIIAASIAAAFVGGIWTKRWSDITEAGTLVARGRGAIRSLTFLSMSVNHLQARVRVYSNRHRP